MTYEDIKQHALEAEKVWGEAYDILWPLINKKKLRHGAEIGVAFGGHAERILSRTGATLFCIDPYKHFDNYDDAMNVSNAEFNRLYNFTKNRLQKYGKRVVFVRKSSQHAAISIKTHLDFVYIDGDHSESGIKDDLLNWFPKIADGGIIAGHDYGHPNFPGVKKIIDQFFGRFNWKIHTYPSGVWWVEKKFLNISYIMPAYNCEKTITSSVDSIYKSNFVKGDELIIVNDVSSDSTLTLITKLSKKYINLKVITPKHHLGGGGARNLGVENTKNELIFCLDSDNILERSSIKHLKKTLTSTLFDIVSFERLKYFKKSIKAVDHEWRFELSSYDSSNYLASQKVPGASGNYLYTKKSWIQSGGYPVESAALDTWGFGLRQVMTGHLMTVVPDTYYYHRYGYNSYWVRESQKHNISLRATQLLIPYFNRIESKDIDYLLSKNHRHTWFDTLDIHPIKYQAARKINLLTKIIKKIEAFL